MRRSHEEEKARIRRHFQGRKNAIAAIKEASPCSDCGEFFPSCVMDFDHVRGEKTACVSALAGNNWEEVLAEIEKCDLVCANCHRIRTNERRQARNVRGCDDKVPKRVELQVSFDLSDLS